VAIQANKPNNRIFLLLGVVLAALAFGGVLLALRQGSGGNNVSVVVAKTSITSGSPVTADEVTLASVPSTAAPQDAFTDPAQVVGKTIEASVTQNTPMVPALFTVQAVLPGAAGTTAAGSTPASLATSVTKGYVAVAIPAAGVPATNGLVGDLMAVGYYIQAGDHIDILVDPGTGGVRYSFQDVPVLRVGDNGAAPTSAATVYIVEVPRSQAELVTELFAQRGCSAAPCVTAVKYVIRAQSEWGKLTATTYTPNYEPTTGGPTVPTTADSTVTPGTLDALFGH